MHILLAPFGHFGFLAIITPMAMPQTEMFHQYLQYQKMMVFDYFDFMTSFMALFPHIMVIHGLFMPLLCFNVIFFRFTFDSLIIKTIFIFNHLYPYHGFKWPKFDSKLFWTQNPPKWQFEDSFRAAPKWSQGRLEMESGGLIFSSHFSSFFLILSTVRGESCTILTSVKICFIYVNMLN